MIETPAASGAQSNVPALAKAGAGRLIRGRFTRTMLFAGLSLSTGAWAAHSSGTGDVSTASTTTAYRDGPPPGFSGGFKEDHCQACHSPEKDGRVNASPGTLTIAAPPRYSPGKTYTVTITLTRPDMVLGGFQLTSRFEDGGAQAGRLAVVARDTSRVKVTTDRGVQYAYHLKAGAELTAPRTARWTLRWTAPPDRRNVLFHVAANAANADESQFGDFIYTRSARSRGR